ncbi:GNAT family N-acetyltransferase [Chloroflexota bacterium]
MLKLNYKLVESDNELKEAFQVRKRVFVGEQGISEDLELDGYDSKALHMVVQYGERIIGTARVLFPTPGMAKIERMAILKTFRRKGIGSKILSFLNGRLKIKKISKVIAHAQYSAIPFYKSCGFVESGVPFNEAGIPHIKMEIQL